MTRLKRRGTRAVLLGAKAAGFGGTVLKVLGLPGGFDFAAVHRWISPIQPPMVFVTEISFFFHCSQGFFG